MTDHAILELPGYTTLSGATLDLKLAWKSFGKLNRARDNVVVIPTFYGGRHQTTEYMVGKHRAIDPRKYFVVIPNMFGNGLSSSPSNTPGAYGRGGFPQISLHDNITCQYQLLTEHLGVKRVRLVAGFSMGGMQAYQWGALYPEFVQAIAPICASARTSDHNWLFVDSAKATLMLDPEFRQGWYETPPLRGLLAFGRVYAAWLFSQQFMREQLYRELGLSSRADVVRLTQDYFLQNDANDLIAMADTWLNGDISANARFNGNLKAALKAITCRAIVMPGRTDQYFPPEDNAIEVKHMPNAELRVIPSGWGHGAGFGLSPADNQFIDAALAELLAA